jgi:hypothetical protein
MKSSLIMLLLLYALALSAQDVSQHSEHYLFDKFYEGKVYVKGAKVNTVPLNYNALTTEMIFEKSGKPLAIANTESVDSVVINGRLFVPVEDKFYEILTHTPHALYREYTCTVKPPETNTGYGTTTTTAATALRGVYGQNNLYYQLVLPSDYKVYARQTFWIKTSEGFRRFSNEQQLKKLFPEKKDQISEWVKKNNTSFSKQEDLALLVKQIDQ